MQYVESVVDLVGNTPLVKLNSVTSGLRATVLAKVEYVNPGGSVKDRIALRMIEAAEQSGQLRPGGTIVEPTSGNTGVGLAMVAQRKGYRCVFVCPDKVSQDKINVLRAYGAEVVVCPTAVAPEHPDSYYNVSDRLVSEIPDAWKPDQYSNPNNPLSHYHSTGPELWTQTDGRISAFVAGVGTGGTISGRALPQRGLRRPGEDHRRRPGGLRSAPAAPGRPYLIEGVGEGLLAGVCYDREVTDEVLAVSGQGRVPAPAGPRGGPAGGRLLRDGGGGRAALRRASRRGRRGRGPAAGLRPRLPVEDLQRRLAWPTTAS